LILFSIGLYIVVSESPTDMSALADLDKSMSNKLFVEVKEIQEMALKKLEQKYTELESKLLEQKAGLVDPTEMNSIKAQVKKNVRSKLGLEEE